MLHVSDPNEPYPSASALEAATTAHTQRNFTVRSRKLPISKSAAIDTMSAALGIPVPEMIFGDNLVSVTHDPSGWTVGFNAFDALDLVDKTDRNMLQVAYAGAWSESRERTSAGIKEVVRPFDWSYSTTYRGSVNPGGSGVPGLSGGGPPTNAPSSAFSPAASADGAKENQAPAAASEAGSSSSVSYDGGVRAGFRPTTKEIPLELLKRRDPILFHDEVILYESELDDNGISMLSVKVRVMELRMLLLCRLYMRLDDVVVRVRDTRLYVDFAADEVTREYTAREDRFDNVKRVSCLPPVLPPRGSLGTAESAVG